MSSSQCSFSFSRRMSARRYSKGWKRTLKKGGLLLLHGYRPEQVDYATGGPPYRENMYTEDFLRRAFGDLSIERLAQPMIPSSRKARVMWANQPLSIWWRRNRNTSVPHLSPVSPAPQPRSRPPAPDGLADHPNHCAVPIAERSPAGRRHARAPTPSRSRCRPASRSTSPRGDARSAAGRSCRHYGRCQEFAGSARHEACPMFARMKLA